MEEEKLDIMTPEYTSPGRADVRAILRQLTRWLKWPEFSVAYDMGLQEDLDYRNDSGELCSSLKIPSSVLIRG
jgi:anaphase-promoting complex subunit 1